MNRCLSRRQVVQGVGVAGLALVAACRRLPWRAEQPAQVPRLGVLLFGTPQQDPGLNGFRRGLEEPGYGEGQTLSIEYRYAEGHP